MNRYRLGDKIAVENYWTEGDDSTLYAVVVESDSDVVSASFRSPSGTPLIDQFPANSLLVKKADHMEFPEDLENMALALSHGV